MFDYQVGNLWLQGIDGTGTTAAVMEGWNDPNIGKVMAQFDKAFGLPKAQIKTIFPTGDHKLPANCPPGMVALQTYGSCDAWAGELDLDVASVHIMAPYAKILIVVAPPDSQITDDAASQVAPPEFMQALEVISSEHLANVVSISDSTAESTYSHGFKEIYEQDAGELTAAKFGLPVLVGTGDCNAVQHLAVGPGSCDPNLVTKGRATAAWDDSPWVTAVGGTIPNFNSKGQRAGSDPVWNLGSQGLPFGEGAGFSAAFARPELPERRRQDHQVQPAFRARHLAERLGRHLRVRTAAERHPRPGHPAQPRPERRPHQPAPLQRPRPGRAQGRHRRRRHRQQQRDQEQKVAVKGFAAAKGFDVASGWGTVRANTFAPALVKATAAAHQDAAVRAEAIAGADQARAPGGHSAAAWSAEADRRMLSAQGFLAGHPVVLAIDKHTVATLTASSNGAVHFTIKPAALGLGRGRHADHPVQHADHLHRFLPG